MLFSSEAILRSLERRQQRLDTKLRDMQRITDDARFSTSIASHVDEWTTGKTTLDFGSDALPAFSVEDFEDFDEEKSNRRGTRPVRGTGIQVGSGSGHGRADDPRKPAG